METEAMADGLIEGRNDGQEIEQAIKQGIEKDIGAIRHDWRRTEAEALYNLPFADLMFRAQSIHRNHFDPNQIETASLLSIKTGGCPEDCGYCSQRAHYETGLKVDEAGVVEGPRGCYCQARACDAGASRFCMAAAWRNPKDRDP